MKLVKTNPHIDLAFVHGTVEMIRARMREKRLSLLCFIKIKSLEYTTVKKSGQTRPH